MDITTALRMGAGLGAHPAFADLFARARVVAARNPYEELKLWLETKPPFAHWFFKCEPITLGANASRSPITGYVLDAGYYGVLRFIANQVGNPPDYPSVTFALEFDGAPLPGYASIIGSIGSIENPLAMMDGLIGGQTVRWVASNSTASAISNVFGYMRGWFWVGGQAADAGG